MIRICYNMFMDFQKVFMESNFRKKVIGKAKRGGGAIYHYDKGDEFWELVKKIN